MESPAQAENAATEAQATGTVQPSHAEASVIGKLLVPDPGVMIWVWVVFLILLVVLKKYAWSPILKGIQAREKTLRDSLEQAEEVSRQAQANEVLQRQLMDQARAESAKLLEEQREVARELRARAEEEAEASAERMLTQARSEIEATRSQAQAQLQRDAAALSLSVAEKILREKLDEKADRAFSEKMVQEAIAS